MINSKIDQITFLNQQFFIKRDDLLDEEFSGNKARKLFYFLQHDFPHIDTLVSYGSAQSNAMYSLSVLAKMKGWKFIYHVDHIASFLKENPNGNYKAALNNGMHILEASFDTSAYTDKNILFINEGGANKEAQFGLKILAQEIEDFKNIHNISNLKVFLPSGTGTTALFLQKYLQDEVLTCPCVGDSTYLKKQFIQLNDKIKEHPTILPSSKKYHFGKLYKQNYEIWKKLKNETDIEFDLLYDPIGWQVLLENLNKYSSYPIIYIHQGGLQGNVTMLERYMRKYDTTDN